MTTRRSGGLALRFGTVAAFLWTALGGCGRPSDGTPDAVVVSRVARSTEGMVVSGSEPATLAGAEILGAGGNAVDAAVATAFALAVTEPTQSGLGGRTQALVRMPDGSAFGVDATTSVPASYDPATATEVEDGYGVVAIPGTVAGLARLLDEAGSMPLSRVMAPAIRLAEEGFALSEGEAGRLDSVRDRLVLDEAARLAFLAGDANAHPPSDTLRQSDLARVLRAIADEGPGVFYRGWIAERIVSDLARNDGYVTAADLEAYAPEAAVVVEGRFGSLRLLGTYIPASGATTIEALQILDRLPLASLDAEARALATGRALLMAFEDRDTAWNDTRPPEQDAAWITSPERALQRSIELTGRSPAPGAGALEPAPESPNTTHVSVVDRNGMAVALTQSLGPTGGSRVVTPGLGFLYATTLGGYLGPLEPGDRPWSSQSPLVAERDGRVAYVLGGAGARRIISALVQTLVRIEVDGDPVEEALRAPRFHPSSSWTFEQPSGAGEPPGAASARSAGYAVRVRPSGTFFARLNVITIGDDGSMTGVADPRWSWGAAAGPLGDRMGAR